jgi:hypothetical protein
MQAAIAHLEHGRDEGAIGSVLVSIFIQGIEEAKALLGTTSDPTLRLFFLTTAGSLLECLTEAQQRAWAASACAATRAPRIAIRTGAACLKPPPDRSSIACSRASPSLPRGPCRSRLWG